MKNPSWKSCDVSAFDRLPSITALVMDVDGVLTDGTFIWSVSGEESKRFSFEDVMGLSLARRAGLKLGLISGEESPLIDRFAEKVGVFKVYTGCKEKAVALREFAVLTATPLERIAFIGDDVNDMPAILIAGISVAPTNAQAEVKKAVAVVLSRSGGQGAVREFVEMILAARASKPQHGRSEKS